MWHAAGRTLSLTYLSLDLDTTVTCLGIATHAMCEYKRALNSHQTVQPVGACAILAISLFLSQSVYRAIFTVLIVIFTHISLYVMLIWLYIEIVAL